MMVIALSLMIMHGVSETYHWPLDLPRELTSSFGEYRAGRFHAGIDLRTQGVIGKHVYAADDGYVSRVRCSPWGYGKAIYLQLPDGNTVVYGHLDDYYPELRAYVQRAQHKAKSYVVDLVPAPNELRVTRGQQIARSGQTGIGAPHLHYELRDSAQNPINPRLIGITWPDTVRPEIHGVLVVPRDGTGSVNGKLEPTTLGVRATGAGKYVTDAVTASGAIGFAVAHVDPASGGAYKLGVWRMRVLAEGREIFRVQCDRYSYDDGNDGTVAFHPYATDRRYKTMWRWKGNEHGFYTHTPEGGWYTVPAAGGEIALELTDFHDNMAVVTVPVRPELTVSPVTAPGGGAGSLSIDVHGEWLTVTASFTGAEPEMPEALVEGAGDIHRLTWRRVNSMAFQAAFDPPATGRYQLRVTHPRMPGVQERELAAFVRGQAGAITLGDVTLHGQADMPYGTVFVQVLPPKGTGPSSGELRTVSPVYRLWPQGAPIDRNLTVSVPLPAGVETAHLHAYRDRGSYWSRLSTRVEGGRVHFDTGGLGDFALCVDTAAPRVSSFSVAEGTALPSARPEIRATVTDGGSGIASWNLTCGGTWLLTAYDPDHNRLYWEEDHDLPAGPQELRLTVTDEAGNTVVITRNVTVPGQ
jgi:murein DD-endopeptidase MepM/ murein hydrolase activator NlpD